MCHHATKIIRFRGWNEVGRAVFYERGKHEWQELKVTEQEWKSRNE